MNTQEFRDEVNRLLERDECSSRFHATFNALLDAKDAGLSNQQKLEVLLRHGYAQVCIDGTIADDIFFDIAMDNGFEETDLEELLQ